MSMTTHITKKSHAYTMHPKINKEITHATYYLQRNPIVAVYPTVFLRSLLFFASFLQIQCMSKLSENNLSEQEYERMREWKRAQPKNGPKARNCFSEVFLQLMSLFSSFSFIFL